LKSAAVVEGSKELSIEVETSSMENLTPSYSRFPAQKGNLQTLLTDKKLDTDDYD